MAAPTGAPDLDILSRLENIIGDDDTPPSLPEDTRETNPEEEPPPEVKEPGEEPPPVVTEPEAETPPQLTEEETATAAEKSDEELRTMADLAQMFEVEEGELLEHLQIPGADGVTVPLSKVIDTYNNAPAAVRQYQDLQAKENAFLQESAQMRVRTDEQVRELAVHAQTLLDMTNEEFKDVDWKKLEVEDPQSYLILKNKQQERGQAIQRAIEKMRGMEHQRANEVQTSGNLNQQQQMEALHGKMPHWRDPVVAQPAMKETSGYLAEMGFSTDEINGITDHRYLLVSWEASQYRKLKNQTPKKIEKLRRLPSPKKVLRTGARRDLSADSKKASQQKMDRLIKTGDERDAARIFEEMI